MWIHINTPTETTLESIMKVNNLGAVATNINLAVFPPIDPKDPDFEGKTARRASQIEGMRHPTGPRVALVGSEDDQHCIVVTY